MAKLDEISPAAATLSDQMSELIGYKKSELNRLQGEVLAEQGTLSRLKAEIDETKKNAKYEHQIEEEKFKQGLQDQATVLQRERRELERLDLELNSRRKDVEQLEAQAEPIKEAMQKLADERIAIEQQRVRNEEMRSEYDRLVNATSAAHEEVSQLKATLTAEKDKVHLQTIEQEQRDNNLKQREAEIASALENLNAIKESIDPKLQQVSELQAKAEADRVQAETIHADVVKRQSDLDKQKADLAILSSSLEARASALTDFDASLRKTADELRIKIQQSEVAEVKAIPIPEPPAA